MTDLPSSVANMTKGFLWEKVTLGESEAKTFLLKGNKNNLYLKILPNSSVENLHLERERLEWLQGKLPVPEVVIYDKVESNEYLLTTELAGVNASAKSHISNVLLMMKELALGLRVIHAVNIDDCPFINKLDIKIEQARERVHKQLVDEEDFDEVRKGQKAVNLFEELISQKPSSEDLVFTHGDYCLPNIIIHEGKVNGFIDWGRAGIADRYQDIALAVRSITRNFGKEYTETFFEEYGLTQLDRTKIEYYQKLDEFF
jgi:aminoglycoside phosphotransferase